MIEKIKTQVIGLCKEKNPSFIPYIKSVADYALQLAKILKADKKVVEFAAWLKDIKRIEGMTYLHNVYSADAAAKILNELGFSDEMRLKKIKNCILSTDDNTYPPTSLESKILVCANALTVLDAPLPEMFDAYKYKPAEEARTLVFNRYKHAFDKIMLPEAKEMAKEKYENIENFFK